MQENKCSAITFFEKEGVSKICPILAKFGSSYCQFHNSILKSSLKSRKSLLCGQRKCNRFQYNTSGYCARHFNEYRGRMSCQRLIGGQKCNEPSDFNAPQSGICYEHICHYLSCRRMNLYPEANFCVMHIDFDDEKIAREILFRLEWTFEWYRVKMQILIPEEVRREIYEYLGWLIIRLRFSK